MIPVVFVHGFMGGSKQWRGQIEALGDCDVIPLDLPGYGENAHLAGFQQISQMAHWALEHLTERGVARFHLLGHSMGGMVVQEMIAKAPERVEKLVLYGTGAKGVLPGRFETIETSKTRACADGAVATARRIAATWFSETGAAPPFENCAGIAERSSLQAILAGLDAMQAWDGQDRLQAIKARTLIVWGDQDRTYTWAQTQQLWQSIEDARLAVLPDCAHAVHLEKPELFNKVLHDFLMS